MDIIHHPLVEMVWNYWPMCVVFITPVRSFLNIFIFPIYALTWWLELPWNFIGEVMVGGTVSSIILFWAGLAQIPIFLIPIFGWILFLFELIMIPIIWWNTTTIPMQILEMSVIVLTIVLPICAEGHCKST